MMGTELRLAACKAVPYLLYYFSSLVKGGVLFLWGIYLEVLRASAWFSAQGSFPTILGLGVGHRWCQGAHQDLLSPELSLRPKVLQSFKPTPCLP